MSDVYLSSSAPPTGSPVAPLADSSEYFAWAYAIAAGIGILAVFLSPALWPIPSATIVFYYVLGHRRAKDGGTIFEFADSVYYLGFTLSVGSLLASLDPFALRGKPDPETIFHYFGLGLLTTLIGIVLRTVVQQFYRLPSETVEAANRRVREETNQLVSELASLRSRVMEHAATAVMTYQDQLLPQLGELATSAALVAGRFSSAANVALLIETNSNKVASAVDRLGISYDGATRTFDAEHLRFIEAHKSFASDLALASSAIEQASHAAAVGLNDVRASANSGASSLGALVQAIRPTSETAEGLRHALAAVTVGVSEASGALHDGIARLKKQARSVQGAAGSIQRSSDAIEQVDLGGHLSTLALQVEKLASSVGDQQQLTVKETGVLAESVASALSACQSLHKAVQEIADILTVRLEGSA